jgi:dihydrodipicolinate synthase/N-acetylneuraminate lyase
MHLTGILLPFTTPFKENEDLDLEALRANLRHWNTTGISGYVALGSTGERVNLNEREYLEVIQTAREEVPKNLTFMVGAGQQSTRQTITEIKTAASAGADAVLVITPSFYRAAITPESLVTHYTAVADASPVPIILYSMPDLTGIAIEPAVAARLSGHPNIIGMKDSSNDIPRFKQTMSLLGPDFALMTGNGTVLYDALLAGAKAAVLAVGCTAAATCLEIYRLVTQGDHEAARALQEKLTPLALAVTKRYGIGGLKAALDFVGLKGGAVRGPLRAPGEDARREISQLLEAVVKHSSSQQDSYQDGFAGALRS